MLEGIPAVDRQCNLYRFTSQPKVERIIQEDAFGSEDLESMPDSDDVEMYNFMAEA